MSKKFFRRWMPNHKKLQSYKALRIFGNALYDPNLWHLNRHSVASAISIGFFCGWLPFPGHMLISGTLSIWRHANLPLALATVWFSNPFTIPPQFYFAYHVGLYLLHEEATHFHIELSWHWMTEQLILIWKPLLLGSLLCGFLCAITSNLLIRFLWRRNVSKKWKQREKKRRQHDTRHNQS